MNDLKQRVISLSSAAAMLAGSGISPAAAYAVGLMAADGSPQLYINEVCTGNNGGNGNTTAAVDNKGGYCDWIEIYNAGGEDENLLGFTILKDDKSEYAFGDLTVPAGGTLLIFSCKNFAGDSSLPNTGYNLSGDGVKLALVDDGGNQLDVTEVPALADDVTWARKPDGTGDFTLLAPTPDGSNNDAQSMIPCNAPVFSAESGMYSEAFDLALSTDEGSEIYYTTDGSDPAVSETRIKYELPINIYNRSKENYSLINRADVGDITPWGGRKPANSAVDKGTVVRAVTLSADGRYSEVLTRSYFVGVSSKNHNGLPIISVTTDPDNLFDYEKGIFIKGKTYDDFKKSGGVIDDEGNAPANYNQRGKDWERACHIDFFEADGTLAVSQDCGMRTQGAYSRAAYQKSMRFYARDEYGEKNFKYPFFENAYKEDGSGEQLKKFKKIVARAGGNDIEYAKYKDSYIQSLVSDRAIDTQEGRPCVMYIDGEYWGLYTLQEDYDDHYYEENYGVNADEVMVYKKGEMDEGLETDIEYFKELRSFAQVHDLSNQANYEKICEMIDVQSFIDYMAVEMYIINEDWPGNNYSLWRTRTVDPSNPYADGRWRFNLYDTEMGVDHYGNSSTKYNRNNLKNIMSNKYDDMPVIFNALLKNEGFKKQFINTFLDLTYKNFDPDTVAQKEKSFYSAYYPELNKNFNRYPNWANTGNATDPCIERMRYFFNNRPSYVPTMLKTDFSLSAAVPVNVTTINPDGGSIRLNTIDLDTAEKFSGKYFPEVDITLTAAAKEGYKFVGWAGSYSSSETTITISPEKASQLQAVFVRDGEENAICKVTFTDGKKSVEMYAAKGGSADFPADSFIREGYTASASQKTDNITADTVVNVKYTGISYKIRFNSNGSKEPSYDQKMTYGSGAALDKAKFSRDGYVFYGWAKVPSAKIIDYADGHKITDGLTTKDGAIVNLYALWKRDISAAKATGVNASYVYAGKAVRPKVTLTLDDKTLSAGVDYTVSYAGGTSCGRATVTIKGKGSYAGSITLSYKVVPSTVKISKVNRSKTALRLIWKPVAGAQNYKVYRKQGSSYKLVCTTANTEYLDKKLTSGKVYSYRVLAAGGGINGTYTAISTATKTDKPVLSVKSSAKGKAKLSWNKVKNADGFQIVMSGSKTSGYKAIKYPRAATTAYTKSGLKSGKVYYFKIRTYKKVGSSKLYSDYSNVVKVRVK